MALLNIYDSLTARLRASGDYVWPLALRLIMAWEFWESGITKLRGQNWFADIPWHEWQKGFPLPFSQLPVELNWLLATWGEMIFAGLLLLGLFTRFSAVSLLVVTAVATAAVHWPAEWSSLAELWEGYVISSDGAGNYKLPLLFIVMLLPLVFHGGGRISLDHLLINLTGRNSELEEHTWGLQSLGLALFVLGLGTVWLEPNWGISFFVASVIAILIPEVTGKT